MAILHDKKLIFIHIPKNAGTAIKKCLGVSLWGHENWQQLKKKYPRCWSEYTKFAIIRNPWDRAVSCYEFSKMENSFWHTSDDKFIEGRKLKPHPDYEIIRDKSFLEVLELLQNGELVGTHWLPQHPYITDNNYNIIIDKIIKLEELTIEWPPFAKRFGISSELKNINISERLSTNYRDYYCDNSLRIIEEYYTKDTELFGYSFDGTNDNR